MDAVFIAFMGNEASDADSICSPTCMEFFEGMIQSGLIAKDRRNLDGAVKNPGPADAVDVPARGSQVGLVHVPGELLWPNRHALLACTFAHEARRITSILEIK